MTVFDEIQSFHTMMEGNSQTSMAKARYSAQEDKELSTCWSHSIDYLMNLVPTPSSLIGSQNLVGGLLGGNVNATPPSSVPEGKPTPSSSSSSDSTNAAFIQGNISGAGTTLFGSNLLVDSNLNGAFLNNVSPILGQNVGGIGVVGGATSPIGGSGSPTAALNRNNGSNLGGNNPILGLNGSLAGSGGTLDTLVFVGNGLEHLLRNRKTRSYQYLINKRDKVRNCCEKIIKIALPSYCQLYQLHSASQNFHNINTSGNQQELPKEFQPVFKNCRSAIESAMSSLAKIDLEGLEAICNFYDLDTSTTQNMMVLNNSSNNINNQNQQPYILCVSLALAAISKQPLVHLTDHPWKVKLGFSKIAGEILNDARSLQDPEVAVHCVKVVGSLLQTKYQDNDSKKDSSTTKVVSEFVPILIRQLKESGNRKVFLEVCWSLSKITTGNPDATNRLEAPLLLQLLETAIGVENKGAIRPLVVLVRRLAGLPGIAELLLRFMDGNNNSNFLKQSLNSELIIHLCWVISEDLEDERLCLVSGATDINAINNILNVLVKVIQLYSNAEFETHSNNNHSNNNNPQGYNPQGSGSTSLQRTNSRTSCGGTTSTIVPGVIPHQVVVGGASNTMVIQEALKGIGKLGELSFDPTILSFLSEALVLPKVGIREAALESLCVLFLKQHHLLFLCGNNGATLEESAIIIELRKIHSILENQLSELKEINTHIVNNNPNSMQTLSCSTINISSCSTIYSSAQELGYRIRLRVILSPLSVGTTIVSSARGSTATFGEQQSKCYFQAIKGLSDLLFGHYFELHMTNQLNHRDLSGNNATAMTKAIESYKKIVSQIYFPAYCMAFSELFQDEITPQEDVPAVGFDIICQTIARCLQFFDTSNNNHLFLVSAVEALGGAIAHTSPNCDLQGYILPVFVQAIRRIRVERFETIERVCNAINTIILNMNDRKSNFDSAAARNTASDPSTRNSGGTSVGGTIISGGLSGAPSAMATRSLSTNQDVPVTTIDRTTIHRTINARLRELGMESIIEEWIKTWPENKVLQQEATLSLALVSAKAESLITLISSSSTSFYTVLGGAKALCDLARLGYEFSVKEIESSITLLQGSLSTHESRVRQLGDNSLEAQAEILLGLLATRAQRLNFKFPERSDFFIQKISVQNEETGNNNTSSHPGSPHFGSPPRGTTSTNITTGKNSNNNELERGTVNSPQKNTYWYDGGQNSTNLSGPDGSRTSNFLGGGFPNFDPNFGRSVSQGNVSQTPHSPHNSPHLRSVSSGSRDHFGAYGLGSD